MTTSFAATRRQYGCETAHIQAQKNSSVNYSYQPGPRTRVYVTKRSWLDAGTEVLPATANSTTTLTGGPNGYHKSRPAELESLDRRRSPLSTPSDVGGYSLRLSAVLINYREQTL